jgi:peptidyl-prolyl cis-trans isomerase A (cyclophilin A)
MKFNTTLQAGALCAGLFSFHADATIVTLETSVGNIDINLYDATTPATVANFLAYVNTGTYDNTFVHRSIPGFIVQSGGFGYDSSASFEHVATSAPVTNEPKLSNVRATVSMAKPPGNINGATSEFFFNLINNSGSLDGTQGGYSVFGELTDESMAVVDSVAGLSHFSYSGFTNLPLRNYSVDDFTAGTLPSEENFIIILSATVSDAATDTAAGLNPIANPNFSTDTGTTTPPSSGGGGNMGLFSLFLLGAAGAMRRRIKARR